MDGLFTAFVVMLFAAVILLIEGIWLWWSGMHGSAARRISKRLRLMSAGGQGGVERVDILKRRTYSSNPALEKLLRRVASLAMLDRLLLQAGVRWSVAQFVGCSLVMLALGLLVPQMLRVPAVPAIAVLALASCVPWILLMRARSARLRKLEEQLPEAADFLGRALRAGSTGHRRAGAGKLRAVDIADACAQCKAAQAGGAVAGSRGLPRPRAACRPFLRQCHADGGRRDARSHRRRIQVRLRGNQLRRADERGPA
jgi:hypothetical protein